MTQIQNTIENALFAYDPTEYMPIYQDGELANRGMFVAYKARRAMQHLGEFASNTIATTSHIASELGHAAMQ